MNRAIQAELTGYWQQEETVVVQFWIFRKHKVPHPYSRAEENARSLTGIRDDDRNYCQTVPLPKKHAILSRAEKMVT